MEAEETVAAVGAMDAAVARVMAAIEASPGRESTALFVTTDHGMTPVTAIVNIERILRKNEIPARAVSTGTTAFLYFDDPAAVEPSARKLAAYSQLEVLRREALPDYARLGRGPRVPPLIVSAKPPYFIEDASSWPWALRWLGAVGPEFPSAGPFLKATHGYPPATPGMSGILYAWGDGIAKGAELPHARAVDVHPTAAALLGIAPGVPMDGAPIRALLAADTR
jgi:predicted AlkP superfamily pyrophosphatase or phosphodiesterase